MTASSKSSLAPYTDDAPVIEVTDLCKSFGEKEVLKGVSFKVYAGEILGIIGPSGCGKSTILKHLCGLLPWDSGRIVKQSDEIGLVFQASALLNSFTVAENVALALRSRHLHAGKVNAVIQEKLQLVGLSEYADAYPTELSGGQQKRTSFARAIVNDPKIILYDEPTTGLDPVMSTIIEDYMLTLEQKLGAASIVVTHQYSTWSRTADRIMLLHGGKIMWEGKPEQAQTSDNAYIKQFAHAARVGPITI